MKPQASAGSARPPQFYNVFYMTEQEYDVVVVGSGGAGMVAALTAAHNGLSTVLIEKAPTSVDRRPLRRWRLDPQQ